jgi:light-regulated signal transduction histidine kinase (bacteriophytochrome)
VLHSATTDQALSCADLEQELQAFSYTVSHDLSACFRHVSEFSRLLLAEMEISGTVRERSHAEYVRATAVKCQLMLDQLLTYSRVQQKPLQPANHDATQSLTLAIERAPGLRPRDANVSIEPLGEVYADAKLLVMAFEHLIDNAIKFRRSGARPQIAVQPAHDEQAWRVRITDNGLGIDIANREKAFQMFNRLNGEGAFAGVGAGLAICRRIARRHGGDVRFLDCADGACVELSLPYVTDIESKSRLARLH